MITVPAITCPFCKYTVFSRAGHDFRSCKCGKVWIDGGFDYTRVGFDPEIKNPENISKTIKIEQTQEELYSDWNSREDKYGLLPPPILDYDKNEKTIYYQSRLYFLKGKFENGFLLGFYSENPCGCEHDQDQGWAVFNLEGRCTEEECDTKMFGQFAGADWRGWMKSCREWFGKLTYFKNEDGTHIWNITKEF